MPIYGHFPLGTIVTFHYSSPTANDRMPMVLVLTQRHRDGKLHGLNLRYTTPIIQQQLQYYFKTPQQRQQQFINPFQQEPLDQYQKLAQKQKEAKEAQRKESGYVVRPDPNNKIFGVSTFTTTINKVVQMAKGAFGRLSAYIPFGGKRQPPPAPTQFNPLQGLNTVDNPALNDPYRFYYEYVKPLLGPNTRKVYRTYNHDFIRGARIRG